ncbi:RNA polymerase sigma factor SigF [Nocardia sp. NPDC058519]|uniref:RNA polymerase sigma factor SigF n=1 Tax=Nocardia sp. NPDC058519 TaxID=3346535 RepID=UPI00365F7367
MTSSNSRPTRDWKQRSRNSYDDIEPLFAELAALAEGDPARDRLREDLIGRCLPLAEHIARKFSGRGENFDDLLQIARVGMVAAVDRFDPGHGTPFVPFAVPTIMGEVRRHFRDYTWAVRVPRRLKEIQSSLGPAVERLTHELGRVPRPSEIAAHLDVDIAEVTQAMVARNAYQTSSIDAGVETSEGGTPPIAETLGTDDPDFGHVEDYLTVAPLIASLPERERRVLVMRFVHSMTQAEIGEQLGCSQMQVSRLLTKTLKTLRQRASLD